MLDSVDTRMCMRIVVGCIGFKKMRLIMARGDWPGSSGSTGPSLAAPGAGRSISQLIVTHSWANLWHTG